MLKSVAFILGIFLGYTLLSIGCFLMLRIIFQYLAFRDDVQFLAFKQAYVHNPVWKAAFYIHVFSAIVALVAGFSQFSGDFLQRHRKLHRIIGYTYATTILLINVPAGMVLALNANGLLPGRIAFVILDCLWFYFTLKAVLCARARKIAEHRKFMIYSYALTFSAITLRTWKAVLSGLFVIDPIQLYMIDAWLGFVPNLLIAVLIVEWQKRGRLIART